MLSASPFTHTPLLQRSALETGQRDEVTVAYVDVLSLRVEPRLQRYQCLRRHSGESHYRSQVGGHAHEELSVDDQALLLKANEQYLSWPEPARAEDLHTGVTAPPAGQGDSDRQLTERPAQHEEHQQPAADGRQQMPREGGNGNGGDARQQVGVVPAQRPVLPIRQ